MGALQTGLQQSRDAAIKMSPLEMRFVTSATAPGADAYVLY